MTKSAERAEWEALAPIRVALMGWANAADPRNYLRRAEARIADVPTEFHYAARRAIEDVRRAIEAPNLQEE